MDFLPLDLPVTEALLLGLSIYFIQHLLLPGPFSSSLTGMNIFKRDQKATRARVQSSSAHTVPPLKK